MHPTLRYDHLETRLIWIQDRSLQKSATSNAVTADEIPAWFLRRGSLTVTIDGETLHATAGTWVLPRQGHGIVRTSPKSQILSLRFRLRREDGDELYHRRRTLILSRRKNPAILQAANALLAVTGRHKIWFHDGWQPASAGQYFALNSAFAQWLRVYCELMEASGQTRKASQSDPLAAKVHRTLVTWDLSKPFSRAALERLAGASTPTISRRFRAAYGTTPREYLEQRRLAWAQRRLAQSGERIKAITAELGFGSMAQFSHWFRIRNESSPREYRRLFQSSPGR